MCEGEKTREERDVRSCVARPCRWTNEAVSLDNFGGVCAAYRSSLRGASWRASVKRAGAGKKSWGAVKWQKLAAARAVIALKW